MAFGVDGLDPGVAAGLALSDPGAAAAIGIESAAGDYSGFDSSPGVAAAEAEAAFIAAQTAADRSGPVNAGRGGSLAAQAAAYAAGLFTGRDGQEAPGILPGAQVFNAVVEGMAAMFGRDSIGEFGAFPGDAVSVSEGAAASGPAPAALSKAGTESTPMPAGTGTSSLAGSLAASGEAARAEVLADARRRFGRRSTMLTGMLGDPSAAPVSRPSLLGIA